MNEDSSLTFAALTKAYSGWGSFFGLEPSHQLARRRTTLAPPTTLFRRLLDGMQDGNGG